MFTQTLNLQLEATPFRRNEPAIETLLNHAIACGASDASVVDPGEIRINEKLAEICKKPGCPHYGKSRSCPPNVGGPDVFRSWVKECSQAIVVRIDVPIDILYTARRIEVMAVLHELVAGIEINAKARGYVRSRAFAGSSCKEIFCSSHAECRYLSSQKECRHPDIARPSMSGFGIDVGYLMILADWHDKHLLKRSAHGQKMSWIAGLVLIY